MSEASVTSRQCFEGFSTCPSHFGQINFRALRTNSYKQHTKRWKQIQYFKNGRNWCNIRNKTRVIAFFKLTRNTRFIKQWIENPIILLVHISFFNIISSKRITLQYVWVSLWLTMKPDDRLTIRVCLLQSDV